VGAALACVILLGGPGAASAAEASEEVVCVGDSCQPLPPEPEDPTPGTLVPNSGNPPLHISEPKKKKPRKGHRRGGDGHKKHSAARGSTP
jgi:hypothetical protein